MVGEIFFADNLQSKTSLGGDPYHEAESKMLQTFIEVLLKPHRGKQILGSLTQQKIKKSITF